MVRVWKVLSIVLALVFVGGTQTGCQNGRLKAERNALYVQNQELQDNVNRQQSALDSALADQSRMQAELERLRNQQERLDAIQAQLAARGPAPTGGAENFAGIEGVSSEMRGRNIEVTVANDVLFAPGQATLSPTARQALSKVAGVIKEQYANSPIVIEGHTDADPIRKSKWASNQELSEARAQAVSDYLAQQGVSQSRLETIGYGSNQPKGTKAASRRVEIVVMQ